MSGLISYSHIGRLINIFQRNSVYTNVKMKYIFFLNKLPTTTDELRSVSVLDLNAQ